MPKTIASCSNCQFAEVGNTLTWGTVYACRRYPPTPLLLDGECRFFLPTTLGSGWCGEFKKGEPREQVGDFWAAKPAKENLQPEETVPPASHHE